MIFGAKITVQTKRQAVLGHFFTEHVFLPVYSTLPTFHFPFQYHLPSNNLLLYAMKHGNLDPTKKINVLYFKQLTNFKRFISEYIKIQVIQVQTP